MIEKYLRDSIAGKERQAKAEAIAKLNLIPPRIYKALRAQDSVFHLKDTAYLLAKGYIMIMKDTMDIDSEDETDIIDNIKKEKNKKPFPAKDTSNFSPEAILQNDKKKPLIQDSLNEN